jgi:hypothetical protein
MKNDTVSQNLQSALKYVEEDWAVIPLKGKQPLTQHGYKDASKDPAQITQWWTQWPDANVGIVTGDVSGLIVLDIDVKNGHRGDESLRELEEQYGALPITLKSRTASGGWHFVFRVSDRSIKSRKGVRDGIDLLADGSYFVAPPSQIRGEAYEWIDRSEVASCPDWVANLRKPNRRGGDDTATSIPRLIRELFPDGRESNGYWVTRCPFHDDQDPSLSITLENGNFRCFTGHCEAEGTIVNLYAKVKGVSEEEARDIIFPPPDYVIRLNQRHAVVSLDGKEVILTEKYDWQGNYVGVGFSSPSDLTLKYENERTWLGDKNVSIAVAWRRDPRRRQYERVIFEPGDIQAPGSFNLWKGFAVVPKEGDCNLYLSHLFESICNQDQRLYDYVVAWMADAVQRPRSKPGVALVMRGRQGTGKSLACEEFGKLFGLHFVKLAQQRHLLGNFNAHLKEALIVLAEEAFFAGDKAAEGALKDLITAHTLIVEPKGKDVFKVSNYIRLLICSNHDWVIPAGHEERRFLVLDVGDRYIQNHSYFEELVKSMDTGGREALLHYLLHYDLSGINLRSAPKTQALQDNKFHSFAIVERFIFEALENGRWCGHHEEWRQSVACREVHAAYIDYASRVGQNRRSSQTELGKALRRLLGDVRKRQAMTPEGRINVWDFPDLITCRKHFDEVMNWPNHEWGLPETAPAQEWKPEDFDKIWPSI